MFESTGRTCNAQPFSSDLGMGKYSLIVDACLAHECPHTGEVYVLVIINAIYAPSMDHSLIPPFITRSGGIIVNDVPKI